MHPIPFTIDSSLLRELGERLVGRPHIALAELVKNSYDADATEVVIRFRPGRIEVADNGLGMDYDSFKNFWMRIGTPHKQVERVSPELKRPMTGSKGIGRLAVQFLAKELELRTTPERNTSSEIVARVDWEKAVKAGDLTKATADWERRRPVSDFPDSSPHGTEIILRGLNHQWNAGAFRDLALEIWPLQAPFRSNPELKTERQKAFRVALDSPNKEEVEKFDSQMQAILDIWHARIVGKLLRTGGEKTGKVKLSLEFSDHTRIQHEYPAPRKLQALEFEVRVFHLKHRQPHGIKVEVARDYLNQFGGVHVYDGGFHLPYYGPDTDWLDIEMDHSHRLSKSKLLPDNLQVSGGMTYLPTNSRLFGVVHVNTSSERGRSGNGHDHLNIQVTRDRLVDNDSFRHLKELVRYALDFYALHEAKRAFERARKEKATVPEKLDRVEQVLELHRREIPPPLYMTLRKEIGQTIRASEAQKQATQHETGILGALATAGISAMAYEHEASKQLLALEDIAMQLKSPRRSDPDRIRELADRISEWVQRARATRALFSHLLEQENRERRVRFRARSILDQIKEQMAVLTRGITIDTAGIDGALLLPKATFAEWSAIFQNVVINAVNAMLDSPTRKIAVNSTSRGRVRALLVQDTGPGVDLLTAEELFEPFVRKLEISPERRSLGLGGTGLGLTIVRMISTSLDCHVKFVKPAAGFSAAFQLSWTEEE